MDVFFQRLRNVVFWVVFALFLLLLVVRVHGAIQRTSYADQKIYDNGAGVEVYVSHPVEILGSQNGVSYPLAVTFTNQGAKQPLRKYEFVFESSSLLFANAKGEEVAPSIQFTSDYSLVEKSIYVRPFLAEHDLDFHTIHVRVLMNGQELNYSDNSIGINSTVFWFSEINFIAGSFFEISAIISALMAWLIYASDNRQKNIKELLERRKAELLELGSLPVLAQARQLFYLGQKRPGEHWDRDLTNDLNRKRAIFKTKELDFLQAVGAALQAGQAGELVDMERQFADLFGKQTGNHGESVAAMARMIPAAGGPGQLFFSPLWRTTQKENETELSLTTKLFKLWDDFDADVKDLIETVLTQYPGKDVLKILPAAELQSPESEQKQAIAKIEHPPAGSGAVIPPSNTVAKGKRLFDTRQHRRLLRSQEIRSVFSQAELSVPPVSYFIPWEKFPKFMGDSAMVLAWLKDHDLAANPFGYDHKLHPFYPPGVAWPGEWDVFIQPAAPGVAICPTDWDVPSLAVLLRDEYLSKRFTFPVLISLSSENSLQSPPITLAQATARVWLEILPINPEGLLDLPLASRQNLLELLCWETGGRENLLMVLQQSGLKDEPAGKALERKITGLDASVSDRPAPGEQVLLTWAALRPPGLEYTGLILCLGGDSHPSAYSWCERFSPFIPGLLQKKVITKAFTTAFAPAALPLPKKELAWSEKQLKSSLTSQFNAAMEPKMKKQKQVLFPELFGPGAVEEETTDRLVRASYGSLARMLMLGNRLLQEHCNRPSAETYLDPDKI